MIDFSKGDSTNYPFPYMIVEDCFDEETLNKLIQEFPDNSKSNLVMGGRRQMNTSNSRTTFQDYEDWIKTAPTWKSFYDWLNYDQLFHGFMSYYNDELTKWGSVITKDSSLNKDCFLHIDWSTAEDGYVREIHVDSPKRIWNFLIFFNDKEWDGGDFLIHSSDNITTLDHQIWNRELPVYKTIEAKKNLGIFFLSTPDSYHSVSLQSNTKNPRKFIYGSYSYRNGDVFTKRTK